jgi:hypothetical protein
VLENAILIQEKHARRESVHQFLSGCNFGPKIRLLAVAAVAAMLSGSVEARQVGVWQGLSESGEAQDCSESALGCRLVSVFVGRGVVGSQAGSSYGSNGNIGGYSVVTSNWQLDLEALLAAMEAEKIQASQSSNESESGSGLIAALTNASDGGSVSNENSNGALSSGRGGSVGNSGVGNSSSGAGSDFEVPVIDMRSVFMAEGYVARRAGVDNSAGDLVNSAAQSLGGADPSNGAGSSGTGSSGAGTYGVGTAFLAASPADPASSSLVPTPEPSTMALAGFALVALGLFRRRKQ